MKKEIDQETRERVGQWATECLEYWSQFEPGAPITEEMVDGQPEPPDDIKMDATALVAQALACMVESARTGIPTHTPSPESQLITADLLDRAVEHAINGANAQERRDYSRYMWGKLMDGENL